MLIGNPPHVIAVIDGGLVRFGHVADAAGVAGHADLVVLVVSTTPGVRAWSGMALAGTPCTCGGGRDGEDVGADRGDDAGDGREEASARCGGVSLPGDAEAVAADSASVEEGHVVSVHPAAASRTRAASNTDGRVGSQGDGRPGVPCASLAVPTDVRARRVAAGTAARASRQDR